VCFDSLGVCRESVNRVKTLHITNAYHATSGGVSTFYRALLQYANSHARHMRLVVPGEESRIEAVGDYGRIYHVRAQPSPVGDARYRLMWPLARSGREIREILRAELPDLVETSDKYTLPPLSGLLRRSWISGVRRPVLVATSHERMDDTIKAHFRMAPVWDLLSSVYMKQFYFPMFDWHVANSEYTAEELIPASKGHRLYREIRIMPMGVDSLAFTPSLRTPEARCELARMVGVPCDAKLLLYVGRLAMEKNLPLLLSTLERLPSNYLLIIAGDGPLAGWLSTRSGKRLRLIGHTSRAEVPKLYAGADAFLHANPREPFGIAPLEAMAAGLPLVAPNRGGVRSYATHENAWLAEPAPEAFAAAVQNVFKDPAETLRKTALARQTAVEHRWPAIAERFFRLYDEMIAQQPR
jgi:alpha-1,6-mannosyltransferase